MKIVQILLLGMSVAIIMMLFLLTTNILDGLIFGMIDTIIATLDVVPESLKNFVEPLITILTDFRAFVENNGLRIGGGA